MPTSNDGCYEDIIGNNGLRPEQKIAIAVIKLCHEDIKRELPLKSRAWVGNEDLASALKLLLSDTESLMFWCEVAGWDWQIVREAAKRLAFGGQPTKKGKRGPPRKADNLLSAGALKKRQRIDKEMIND